MNSKKNSSRFLFLVILITLSLILPFVFNYIEDFKEDKHPSNYSYFAVEWFKWSKFQTPYFYYEHTSSGLVSSFVLKNYTLKMYEEKMFADSISTLKEISHELQDKLSKYGYVCNPKTAFYIVSATPDSLWVEVITFDSKGAVDNISAKNIKSGFAYKPSLKEIAPD